MASWFTAAPTVPTVSGLVHLAGVGDVPFANSQFAGRKGEGRAIEGFTLQLSPPVAGLSIEYQAHLAGIGDSKWVSNGEFQGTRGQGRAVEGIAVRLTGPAAAGYQVHYSGHLAGKGDVPPVSNGQFLGTKGEGRRLEGFTVWLSAAPTGFGGAAPTISGVAHVSNVGDIPLSTNVYAGGREPAKHLEGFSIQLNPPVPDLGVEYTAHAANVGDLPWVGNGAFQGSRGQGRQIEGVAIRLTGARAAQYSISYDGYVDGLGDQPAQTDGGFLGTKGQGRALGGIRVWLTAKPVYFLSAPTVEGLVHLANVGDVPFHASQFAGRKGEARQLEAFTLQLNPAVPDLGIEYTAHAAGVGDLPWVQNGALAGTRGQGRQLEGIAVRLTGPQSPNFSVHYTTHVAGVGDVAPVSDGAYSGTKGQGRRIEGIQVWITARPIYGAAPASTSYYKPYAYGVVG